jgi:hypothetical protein
VVRGALKVGAVELREGDGASTSDAGPLALEGVNPSEVLLFDLG